jgi:hypothetical protein
MKTQTVLFSALAVALLSGCAEKNPSFNPKASEKAANALELFDKMEDKIIVTNNVTEWGYDLKDYQALGIQERRAVTNRILNETKKAMQLVGIPERGGNGSLSELHQKYLAISDMGFSSALQRFTKSHYSQVMLSRHNVLERGAPEMLTFYTRELLNSGCDNPVLAEKCLLKLKANLPPAEYNQLKTRVLTKIDKLSQDESLVAMNGLKFKEDIEQAEKRLRTE